MWASSQGRVAAVTALLEAGADVNAADNDGGMCYTSFTGCVDRKLCFKYL